MKTFKYATLITGGAKRIGKSISQRLAIENKNIIIHYNKSKKEATELCEELNKNNNILTMPVQADLNEPNQIKNIFNLLKKKSIIVDCLINKDSLSHVYL